MSGYTENRILIYRDFDFTFDLSNRIDLWPQLFTEYQDAQILELSDDYIKFQLTTFPEGNRPSRTWISERYLDKKNKVATAKRLDPTFPFEYMNIRWEYEPLPSDQAVLMTWIQEFNVHPDCQFTVEQMASFLNINTYKQLKSVKNKIENWKSA